MVLALTEREIALLYSEPDLELYRPESVTASFEDGTSGPVTAFNLDEAYAGAEPNLEYAAKLRAVFERLGSPTGELQTLRASG